MINKHREVELDNTLKQALDTLRDTPPRDPQSAAKNRYIYMRQVRNVRKAAGLSAKQTQSLPLLRRNLPMLKPIFAILMAIVLVLGSAGTLAYAAQDDLPGEPLYALKLLGEDVSLALTLGDEAKIEQLQSMTQNRVNELIALAKNSEEAPEPLANRLYTHLETALQLAAGQSDEDLQQSMQQIQTQSQQQIREMNQVNQTGNGVMQQIMQRLQEQQRLAEIGSEDPNQFRQETQLRTQEQPEDGSSQEPAGPKSSEEKPGPQKIEATPTPQGPNGTGDGTGNQSGQGGENSQGGQNGQGGQSLQGPNPTPTPTPTPGPGQYGDNSSGQGNSGGNGNGNNP